ncbi:MAG: glycosyltransferase, partial [Gaiellales bacterium]
MIRLLLGSLGLVAYTFAGYPAAMALRARLRPRPLTTDVSYEPPVSLIILAYNEADVIAETLTNTSALDYTSDLLEIIVVADGSDDATADIARAVPGTRVIHRP